MDGQDICFCLPSFAGGGAEKVFLTLIEECSRAPALEPKQNLNASLRKKINRDLRPKNSADTIRPTIAAQTSCVVLSSEGPLKNRVPSRCVIYDLGGGSAKRCFFQLIQHFRKKKPSIVVSNLAYLNFVIILSLIFARHRPRRIILREANTPKSTIRALKLKFLGILLYRNLYKFADAVICNSRQIKTELLGVGVPGGKIKVIPNPINISELSELAKEKCRLPKFADNLAPLLISIGRLTEQKGFDRLIDWFCELQRDVNLLIVGEGPDEERLNQQIRAVNQTKRIKIIGFQTNPFPLVKKASAVVLASRWEGLPNIGLEALALGKHVIATMECGGLVELAEECSIDNLKIITTGVEFARAVEDIIERDAFYDFSVLAKSTLPSEFEKRNVMQQYTEVIYS